MSDDSRPSPAEIRTAAVIPAAGRGVRLGPGAPKALRALNGTPMLIHAVRALAASRAVSLVVVVAPPDGAGEVKSLLDAHALPERTDFLVVPGGESRQESVKLGLDALPPAYDIVLVPGRSSRSTRSTPSSRPYGKAPWRSFRRCPSRTR
jgi:2-C-methyl-D-erythritol 4-phosphate cytidylyltransferase